MLEYDKKFIGDISAVIGIDSTPLYETEYLLKKKRAQRIHLNLNPANARRQRLAFVSFNRQSLLNLKERED